MGGTASGHSGTSGIGSWAATAGAAPLPGDSIRSFMNYSTSGQIGSTGVDGDPVISFTSTTNASYTASSFFSLGEFQMAPLPTGQTTTVHQHAVLDHLHRPES